MKLLHIQTKPLKRNTIRSFALHANGRLASGARDTAAAPPEFYSHRLRECMEAKEFATRIWKFFVFVMAVTKLCPRGSEDGFISYGFWFVLSPSSLRLPDSNGLRSILRTLFVSEYWFPLLEKVSIVNDEGIKMSKYIYSSCIAYECALFIKQIRRSCNQG